MFWDSACKTTSSNFPKSCIKNPIVHKLGVPRFCTQEDQLILPKVVIKSPMVHKLGVLRFCMQTTSSNCHKSCIQVYHTARRASSKKLLVFYASSFTCSEILDARLAQIAQNCVQESQSSSIRYSKILHARRLPQIAQTCIQEFHSHHLEIVRVEFYCIKTLTLGVQPSGQRKVITSTRKSTWLDCYIDSNKENRRATKKYKLHTWNTPTSMHRRAPISCTSIAKNCPWSGGTCHEIGETQIPRFCVLKGPGPYQTGFFFFLTQALLTLE